MPETPRPSSPLPITRNHLYALGALSLSLAVLAFFVGFAAGRGKASAPPPAPEAKFIPDEVRTGDLEVLLAKVERANTPDAALGFPGELPQSDPPPAPIDPTAPTAPPPEPPPNPFPAEPRPGAAELAASPAVAPSAGEDIPTSGWSIQVGEHTDAADATRYVDTLKAAGLSAYKVIALVDGRSVWRVRVGGYASKEGATAALPAVASKAGAASATVARAP